MAADAMPEQIEVCQRFGSRVCPPDSQLRLAIALQTLHLEPLTAVRHRPEGNTCGWYIWGGEYSSDPDFYQPLCVAHILEYCPQIVPYLSLEPGWGVMLAPGHEDVWFDSDRLE
jgi:hypothetical protein